VARSIPFSGQITYPIFLASRQLALGWKKHLLWVALIFPISPIFIILIVSYINGAPEVLLILPAPILVVLISFFFVRSPWKKVYFNSAYFQSPISGEISASGIRVSSVRGLATIPWSEVTELRFNANVILVYQGPTTFHIFAPDFFSTPDDWEAAIEHVRERLNERQS
jgi:YcxB-like protein